MSTEEIIEALDELRARNALKVLHNMAVKFGKLTAKDIEDEVSYWSATPVFPAGSLGESVDENAS